MADLSTDRLDPATRVPEAQGQGTRGESQPKERRRPTPPPSQPPEPATQPDGPAHQIDRLA